MVLYLRPGSVKHGWGDLTLRHPHAVVGDSLGTALQLFWGVITGRGQRVVAVYGYRGPVRLAALVAARSRRLQVVTRSDSNSSAVASDSSWRRHARRWLLRALFPRSTRVWVIGAANRAFWEQYVGRRNTLLAPYSTPMLPNSTAVQPRPRRSDPTRMRFLFVGRLTAVKALPELIDAFSALDGAEHQDWSLDIVGDGPAREALAAQATGEPRIVFHGACAYVELDRFYLNADVLVLPSAKEAWGLVVNEALAFGLWVIVSDVAGSAELVTDPSRGRTYPAGDVDALVECLRAAAQHLERRPIPPTDPTQTMAADLNRLLDTPAPR